MIETLTDIEDIFGQVFSDNKPGFIISTDLSSDTKTATLTDSIVHEACMLSHVSTINGHHATRLSWQVLPQKFFEVLFTDKADAC